MKSSPLNRKYPRYRWGFCCLVLLCVCLPFEFFQRIYLFDKPFTNLELLIYATAVCAIVTLCLETWQGFLIWWRCRNGVIAPTVILGLALVSCLVSSVISGQREAGLDWTGQFGIYGLIWLALPFWLTGQRVQILSLVIIAGGVFSALLGFAEFFGLNLNGIFKEKATTAGTFIRLSGTFSYANIAAMYYEMVLPLAMINLIRALQRRKQWWIGAVWLVICGILLEAIFLTYSRGAWLGVAVSLTVICFFYFRAGRERIKLTFVLLGAVSLGLGGLTLLVTPLMVLRLNANSDQEWYRAGYVSQIPEQLKECGQISLPVRVTNLSPFTWEKGGNHPLNLTYHWLNADKTIYRFAVQDRELSGDILPNQSELFTIDLIAPEKAGDYFLVWDMHQADINWFSLKSAKYELIPVRVVENENKKCPNIPIYKPVERLPTAVTAPSREQLWQAAVKMIIERPLWGFGAGNFKFNYQEYFEPKPAVQPARVHANNLFLELLTGVGFSGFVLISAFFGLIIRKPLRSLLQGKADLMAIACAGMLTAWLAHGLLDSFVEPHATAILFWLALAIFSGQWSVVSDRLKFTTETN
jgi:O-Antigen ligase